MNDLRLLCCAAVWGATSLAQPVVIDCPAGTRFVPNKGCVAVIAAPAAQCPGGTYFDGKKCVATVVDTSCPDGMHFVTGTGCVRQTTVARAPDSGKPKKGGSFAGGFLGDRLQATCAGLPFEVHGGPRLTGVRAMLLVNGSKLGDEQNVDVGETKRITGQHAGRHIDFQVQQGLWGTRYTLKVDGVECRLSK